MQTGLAARRPCRFLLAALNEPVRPRAPPGMGLYRRLKSAKFRRKVSIPVLYGGMTDGDCGPRSNNFIGRASAGLVQPLVATKIGVGLSSL